VLCIFQLEPFQTSLKVSWAPSLATYVPAAVQAFGR
jgi:hypothetical protein